ncbi:MAG: COX15/CtaA family protein [Phycisphaerales bacterium]|nr:COX15/CtaA family protein [Phycisphaerales bacterium]
MTHQKTAIGDILASAFGITAAAWIIAYICRMPIVNASGQTTVLGMLAIIFLGGLLAARYSHKGLLAALAAGALSGLLDILIIGSLIHDYMSMHGEGQALVPSAALWITGSVLANTLVAGIGGLLSRCFPSLHPLRRNDIHWTQVLAIILAAATFPLITAGGLVTAFRAGLAVLDWPQSYGYNMFLFPLSLMRKKQGNFYEHAHRLMGILVGLTALTTALHITFTIRAATVRERQVPQNRTVAPLRSRLRWQNLLAWSIFAAVCFQGILGGTRVTERSITLAISHGIFAQILFAAITVLAATTSRNFLILPSTPTPSASTDRFLTAALITAVIFQLTLGAILRHIDLLLLLHIAMATFVTLIALLCIVRAWGLHSHHRPLLHSALWTLALLATQLLLGLIALIFRSPPDEPQSITAAFITTAHQANGALLLAFSAVLTTWTWRLLTPERVLGGA